MVAKKRENFQDNKSKRFQLGTLNVLKNYFLTGIATLFPLFITIYVVFLLFQVTNKYAGQYVNNLLLDSYGYSIPGLGLIVTLVVIIIIGFISSNFIGRKLFPIFEKILFKIPFISEIYPSAKQLSDFLFSSNKKSKFKKVVMVEYPTKGSYSIGFITNEELSGLSSISEDNLISVLVPLAPAPFSGILLLLPKDKVKVIDMSVNNAVKFIVSGGVINPDN